MPSVLTSKMLGRELPNIDSAAFRRIIEDHILILENSSMVSYSSVEAGIAYRFEGNFYGLLRHLGVDQSLWWPTLRINGYVNPADYDGETTTIKIISKDQLITMLTRFQQRETIL